MKEWMTTNVMCMIAGSAAIGVACYVTKSAKPLWAFLLIPRWSYNPNRTNKEVVNYEKQLAC